VGANESAALVKIEFWPDFSLFQNLDKGRIHSRRSHRPIHLLKESRKAYNVGKRLKFECSEPNTLTEQIGSTLFEVEITKQLGVWATRRSQVVLVRVTGHDAPKDLTFVAKCFDHMLCPPLIHWSTRAALSSVAPPQ
jgi:hypothetical protein